MAQACVCCGFRVAVGLGSSQSCGWVTHSIPAVAHRPAKGPVIEEMMWNGRLGQASGERCPLSARVAVAFQLLMAPQP